jgi:predicted flap endonuclease-1-like 5' DNA nuclease
MDTAREDRKERDIFVTQIKDAVSDLKQTVVDLRNEFKADMENASQAWSGVSAPPVDQPAPQTEAAAAPATDPHVWPDEPEDDVPVADDVPVDAAPEDDVPVETSSAEDTDELTQIDGIGPARKKHLNDAGVFSLKDLADCTPEDLYASVSKKDKLVAVTGVKKWIDQAKTRV